MCGITGILNLDRSPVSPVTLKRMTNALAHRGPDGEGQWSEGNLGLGHRRLAIIDPTPAGHQPMLSADHRFILSYNGEIYNFMELRLELEAKGYWFRSESDTEVVLNALVEWGVKAFDKFNGMFALCFWDRQKEKLLLARDRYGIKPLYYGISNNTLAFASEQKAILEHSEFTKTLNKAALYEYFTFQNIFTDNTLIESIRLLPAGHFAQVNTKAVTPEFRVTQYWDYHFSEPKERATRDEYREELNRLFVQAVNRQLVSDTELGCYLSGGIDSGSISAIAARSLPYVKTFTCGFDLRSASGLEMGYDERAKAEHMSYHFKTEHYEMVLKAGDMERCLSSLTYHLEEPRVGQSYPNYYAAKLASKFVNVVLSGAGGDEMFGGYPWRYYRAVASKSFDDYIDHYYTFWQRLLPNSALKKLFSPIQQDVEHVWTRDIFKDVFKNHQTTPHSAEDYINHSLYFEAKTFLHGLLVVEDKLSMAHGLETRLPFLDNDLVDFAMRCPVSLKLNNLADVIRINENEPGSKTNQYFQKTNDGKQILRDVMSQYIPSSVAEANKQGFSAPDSSWFKGDSIDFVRQTLTKKNNPIYELVDRSIVSSLLEEHFQGKKNRRLLIWSLLNVSEVLEQMRA